MRVLLPRVVYLHQDVGEPIVDGLFELIECARCAVRLRAEPTTVPTGHWIDSTPECPAR